MVSGVLPLVLSFFAIGLITVLLVFRDVRPFQQRECLEVRIEPAVGRQGGREWASRLLSLKRGDSSSKIGIFVTRTLT
jgi:hypothetical protein